jgi:hypothetical protein
MVSSENGGSLMGTILDPLDICGPPDMHLKSPLGVKYLSETVFLKEIMY